MNIDWNARLRSKAFWVSMVSLIVLLIKQLGILQVPENWNDVLTTVLSILSAMGIIVDPSTPGLSDGNSQK
jgi:phi LC3 family holin